MDADHLQFIENVNAERHKDGTSRRRFMGTVVAAAGGLAGAAALGVGSSTVAFADSPSTIINTAITAEALAITYLGAVLAGAYANPVLPADQVVASVLTAARAEEQDHYNYLKAAGAVPITTTFTVPASADPTSKTAALQTIVAAEGLFVNAYLAATNQFASDGNYKLATVAASILGVEAEHRALARAALVLGGDSSFSPPNNVAYEQAPYPSVSAVGQELVTLGFINGSGAQATYPGPGTIDGTGVTGTTPPSLTPEGSGCATSTSTSGTTTTSPSMPDTGAPIARSVDVPGALLGLAVGGGGAALIGALVGRSRQQRG